MALMLGSTLGMTGSPFQASRSMGVTLGSGVRDGLLVGSGSSAMEVGRGVLEGDLTGDGSRGMTSLSLAISAGEGVGRGGDIVRVGVKAETSAAHAVSKTQNTKLIMRFIARKYSWKKLSKSEFYATLPAMRYQGLLHKYGHLLDLPPHTRPISLLEGNTPLIKAEALSRQLGGGFEVFIK